MQVPRTKKTPKEPPELRAQVPYPAWDSDWDGRRRARRRRARRAGADAPHSVGEARPVRRDVARRQAHPRRRRGGTRPSRRVEVTESLDSGRPSRRSNGLKRPMGQGDGGSHRALPARRPTVYADRTRLTGPARKSSPAGPIRTRPCASTSSASSAPSAIRFGGRTRATTAPARYEIVVCHGTSPLHDVAGLGSRRPRRAAAVQLQLLQPWSRRRGACRCAGWAGHLDPPPSRSACTRTAVRPPHRTLNAAQRNFDAAVYDPRLFGRVSSPARAAATIEGATATGAAIVAPPTTWTALPKPQDARRRASQLVTSGGARCLP